MAYLLTFSSFLFVFCASCGTDRKAKEQENGKIPIPDYPYLADESLGLKSIEAQQSKSFFGQLLIWNDNASPETVRNVVQTLSAGNVPRIEKYKFIKEKIIPAIDQFKKTDQSYRAAAAKADPGRALFAKRVDAAQKWFSAEITEFETTLKNSGSTEEEIEQKINLSRARFQDYCEAKIWQRVFLKAHKNSRHLQRPLPLAQCATVYKDLGLLSEKTDLCAASSEGKDYRECLWFEGVLKSRIFKEEWLGNNPEVARQLMSRENFGRLLKIADDEKSLVDVTSSLLSGDEILDEQGDEIVPAIEAAKRFEKFSYKKCRRYRPGCRPSINVRASKLRSLIEYIESDNRILLFSGEMRGSNGLSHTAQYDISDVSLNEIYFNDPFLTTNVERENHFDEWDKLASEEIPNFSLTVYDQGSIKILKGIEARRTVELEKIRTLGERLSKDMNVTLEETSSGPNYKCAESDNLFCPIQLSSNQALKLAIRREVSIGFYRGVSLTIRDASAELKEQNLSTPEGFGAPRFYRGTLSFSDSGSKEFCITNIPNIMSEDLLANLKCDDMLAIDSESGAISFDLPLDSDETIKSIGFNASADRPPESINLFSSKGGTQTLDFNLMTAACSDGQLNITGPCGEVAQQLNLLHGKRIKVRFVPFAVAGLFEKMSGTFTIVDEKDNIRAIGNLSLSETESTNPLDQVWIEFSNKYLSAK